MRLLFYFFFYPLSLLPMWALYGLGNVMYFILAHIIHYRDAVLTQNLSRSFPEKSEQEIKQLKKANLKHLSRIAVEMIKMLTMSKKSVMKRYKCINPEMVNRYFAQGKSVILTSGHLNNWEWMVLSLGMQFKHHGVGVGKENSNKTFQEIVNARRTRYGTEVLFASNVRPKFEQYTSEGKLTVWMMLADQTPNGTKHPFVIPFLGRTTDMIYGPEYFAKKYNLPVLFYKVVQVKRGYYEIHIDHITDTPQETEYGFITKRYAELEEAAIREHPQYWLWTHRRWKHKLPENVTMS